MELGADMALIVPEEILRQACGDRVREIGDVQEARPGMFVRGVAEEEWGISFPVRFRNAGRRSAVKAAARPTDMAQKPSNQSPFRLPG